MKELTFSARWLHSSAGILFITLQRAADGNRWDHLLGKCDRGRKIAETRALWNFLWCSGLPEPWAVVTGSVFPEGWEGFSSSLCPIPVHTSQGAREKGIFTQPWFILNCMELISSLHSGKERALSFYLLFNPLARIDQGTLNRSDTCLFECPAGAGP